jgi:hypothetical protein
MRNSIVLIPFIVLTTAMAAIAPVKLLPAEKDVPGWKIVPGAKIEARGDDIQKIYDGGYEFYIEHGVTQAARNLYIKDGVVMEITVHTMKSAKSAKDFFTYWQKELKPQKVEQGKGYSMFTSAKPLVGWLVSGVYCVSAVPSNAGESSSKDTRLFLLAVQKKVKSSETRK